MAEHLHVLIVGANSGVGAALLRELLSGSHRVSVIGRRAVEGFSGFQRVTALGQADWPQLLAEVEAVAPLDAVVFVAGDAAFGVSAEIPEPVARELLELNFWAVAKAAMAAGERWGAARRPGVFIPVLSLSARRGMPFEAFYCASKAAIDRFIEALRFEYPESIRFEPVYPGLIATPFHRKVRWFGMPTPTESPGGDPPEQTVTAILATLQGAPHLHVVGRKSRAIRALDRLTPWLYDQVARRRWRDFVKQRGYQITKR